MDATGQPEQEPVEAEVQTNMDRLLGHLPEGSLVAELVRAARDVEPDQSAPDAMKAVVQARLGQAGVLHDTVED